jgi:quercetin dioxygenase-like cupin family protein
MDGRRQTCGWRECSQGGARPRGRKVYGLRAGLLVLSAGTGAVAQAQDSTLQHVECRRAAPGEKPAPIGCTILGQRTVDKLPRGPLFWYLVAFPTRAAAAAAAGPTSVIADAEGRSWVFTIAPDDGGPWRGELLAQVGPLELPRMQAYTIEVATAVIPPGSRSRVHTHAGPEAWYLLAGEQCLETPSGARRAGAGQSMTQPGYTPMQLVVTGKVVRHALLVVVHDASAGFSAPSDWKPPGRCTEAAPGQTPSPR